jgi:hypothetical protein
MSSEITALTKWEPFIEVLSNKSLKTRHWEEIKKKMNSHFNHKALSLQTFLKLKVKPSIFEDIVDISDKAKKQNRLEDMLMSMKNEWQDQ